jgi:hypothetical protein
VNTVTAQEIPLFVTCLADADKLLEQEFCTLISGAVEVYPGTRLADATDHAVVFMAVIPLEVPECADALAYSVAVTYGGSDQGAPKFYIYSSCDVVPRGDLVKRAVMVIAHANVVTREWMAKNFPGVEDGREPIRLETNP